MGAWGDAVVEVLGAAEIRREEKAAGQPVGNGKVCGKVCRNCVY